MLKACYILFQVTDIGVLFGGMPEETIKNIPASAFTGLTMETMENLPTSTIQVATF